MVSNVQSTWGYITLTYPLIRRKIRFLNSRQLLMRIGAFSNDFLTVSLSMSMKCLLWLKIGFKLKQIGSKKIRLIIWSKLDQLGSNWFKSVHIGSNQINLDQIGSNWFKLDQNRSNWIKLVQTGSSWIKTDHDESD